MSERALLVIADIGGYTKFMKVHRVNLAHAQTIIAMLLEAVIDGAAPKLKLAKLEGDAAFFYARLDGTNAAKDALASFTSVVMRIRQYFLEKQVEFEAGRLCNCDSCMEAKDLKLKFVAHVGEVAFQRVKRFTELAGVDVIFVHRLLKNSVPLSEYVLMSEPVFERLEDEVKTLGNSVHEDLEGLGTMKLQYIDCSELQRERPHMARKPFLERFLCWFKMTVRALPYLTGTRTSCEGFRNFPGLPAPDGTLLLPEGTPSLTPPSLVADSVAPPTRPPPDLVKAAVKSDGA